MSVTTSQLRPGDILLYRGRTILGRFICLVSRSDYCHAAMIGPSGNVLEMYDLNGGRVSFIGQHLAEPIDVFRLIDEDSPIARDAAHRMAGDIHDRYSLWHAVLAGLWSNLPFLGRWFQKECNRHGLHCSQAVSRAYRRVGLDLWPEGPDKATLPGHLAQSPYLRNLGRLEFPYQG